MQRVDQDPIPFLILFGIILLYGVGVEVVQWALMEN